MDKNYLRIILELSLSFLLLVASIIAFLQERSFSKKLPPDLSEVKNFSKYKILLGINCSYNPFYNNVFLSMLGLELGKINYNLSNLGIFCYKSKGNYPTISEYYQLRYIKKPVIIVEFSTTNKEGYCIRNSRIIGNINIYLLKFYSNFSTKEKEYCIATLVYNITLTYFMNNKSLAS